MIPMYCEHGQAHLEAIICEVCLPAQSHITFSDVTPKNLHAASLLLQYLPSEGNVLVRTGMNSLLTLRRTQHTEMQQRHSLIYDIAHVTEVNVCCYF